MKVEAPKETEIEFASGEKSEEKLSIEENPSMETLLYGSDSDVVGAKSGPNPADAIPIGGINGEFVVTGRILIREPNNIVRVIIGKLSS